MAYLVLGLILWTAAHLFKRVAPGLRARMGTAGKGEQMAEGIRLQGARPAPGKSLI